MPSAALPIGVLPVTSEQSTRRILPERAGLYHLHDAPVGGPVVVDVVPHLGNALVFECRGHHGASFADRIRERLLDKNVLARLAGLYGGEGMPVIRRGHHHGVEVFALQKLAEVVERFGLVPLRLLDSRHGGIEVLLIEIADCRRGHVGVLHELIEARCSLAAQPDEADLDLVAGRRPCVRPGSAGDDSPGERLYESSSTGHLQSAYRQAVLHASQNAARRRLHDCRRERAPTSQADSP